jgi:hypothetical protein
LRQKAAEHLRPNQNIENNPMQSSIASRKDASGDATTFDTSGKRQNSMIAPHDQVVSASALTPGVTPSVEGRQPLKPEADKAILE